MRSKSMLSPARWCTSPHQLSYQRTLHLLLQFRAFSQQLRVQYAAEPSDRSRLPTNHALYEKYRKEQAAQAPVPPKQGQLNEDSIFATQLMPKRAQRGSRESSPPATQEEMVTQQAAEFSRGVLDPDPSARKHFERKMIIRAMRRGGRLTKEEVLKRTERSLLSKSPLWPTGIKKLGPLARQIQGKTIEDAIVQMRFSKKLAARWVLRFLEHVKNEAVVRRGMGLGQVNGTAGSPIAIELKNGKRKIVRDQTALYIDEAWVNRGSYERELLHKARGRKAILRHPQTSLSLVVKEEATRVRISNEIEEKRRNRKLWVHLPNRAIQGHQQYYTW